MIRRAGLTLVETLAATALLALLAVSVAGFCADSARTSLRARVDERHSESLEAAVDAIITDPSFVRSMTDRSGSTSAVRRHGDLVVRMARPDAGDDSHAWLVFERDAAVVVRWIKLDPPAGERRP